MFLEEKDLEIPRVVLVLGTGANLTKEHLARNPLGQVPVLELDDGTCISESLVICEYLEELHPQPSLFGETAEQRAQTRMWARRVDLTICEPLGHAFRLSRPGWHRFGGLAPRAPQGVEAMGRIADQHLALVDGHLAENTYLCGERFSCADILLFVSLDQAMRTGQLARGALPAVSRWYQQISDRKSASVSLHSRVDLSEVSGSI
jgi:glutathione S-transferase